MNSARMKMEFAQSKMALANGAPVVSILSLVGVTLRK
jgi:hypothetical protein